MLSKPLFFDYNATSPIYPGLCEVIPEWLKTWGNPSSIHAHGREAKKVLREARQNFANLIGATPMELIFLSGGSEANNTVLKGVLETPLASERNEIISTSVEHPSVLETLEYVESRGFKVHYVPVNRQGEFDMEKYESLLSEKTLLVSVMTANNETGTIFPIGKIAKKAKSVGAFMHTDAVQTLGRMPFHVQEMQIDFASFSGHKFYALKGSGVLFCRRGNTLPNLIHGGGQERGRRAGTENVLGIAAIGYMSQVLKEKNNDYESMRILRDHFEERIVQAIPGASITAKESPRLPNTSSVVIPGVSGESLLMSLDVRGYSVSTGSACSSGSPEPSHVLTSLGLSHDEAQSSLRMSLGWMSTEEQVNDFIETLTHTVDYLRSLSGKEATLPAPTEGVK